MRLAAAFLALGLLAAAPPEQTGPPATEAPANPWRNLFTRWEGATHESLEAESRSEAPPPAVPRDNAIPAWSPLESRSRTEAVALGERVGAVVRAGNCAEGERIAREAGDFALVRAVREHCRPPR